MRGIDNMFNRKYKKLRKIMEMNMEKYYHWGIDKFYQGNIEEAHAWFSRYFTLKNVLKDFDKS